MASSPDEYLQKLRRVRNAKLLAMAQHATIDVFEASRKGEGPDSSLVFTRDCIFNEIERRMRGKHG